MRAIIYGLLGAFFFASTFICNRSMDLSGGSWVWSASLRYIFTLPMLALLLLARGNRGISRSWQHLKKYPKEYLLWSTIGFGLFYAPICFASAYGEGWLVAGTWQIVIITGSLVVPFFYITKTIMVNGVAQEVKIQQKIPWLSLRWSVLMVAGIVIMQFEHAQATSMKEIALCTIPILVAAFAYPLGNRKMMEVCGEEVNTIERVFAMTIASMPFWVLLSLYGLWDTGAPSTHQLIQSSIVALFAGVIGTLLFFAATNLVRDDMHKMASVEATQSGEAVFAFLGEIIILGALVPSFISIFGMLLVVVGMVLHSLWSKAA